MHKNTKPCVNCGCGKSWHGVSKKYQARTGSACTCAKCPGYLSERDRETIAFGGYKTPPLCCIIESA